MQKALDEIVDVHHRYKKFSDLKQQEVISYIDANYKIVSFSDCKLLTED